MYSKRSNIMIQNTKYEPLKSIEPSSFVTPVKIGTFRNRPFFMLSFGSSTKKALVKSLVCTTA